MFFFFCISIIIIVIIQHFQLDLGAGVVLYSKAEKLQGTHSSFLLFRQADSWRPCCGPRVSGHEGFEPGEKMKMMKLVVTSQEHKSSTRVAQEVL